MASYVGTAGNDTYTGTAEADTISGLGGNDLLAGAAGADSISGGDGNDRIDGGGENDTAAGGAGDDTLWSSLGNDLLRGDAGFDTADFGLANGSIDVSLLGGWARDGTFASGNSTNVGNDTLAGIERVVGGRFADRLVGDAGANALLGQGGNDTISGGGGADSLSGGSGADRFEAGAGALATAGQGNDLIDGGTIADTRMGLDANTVSYTGAGAAVSVNLGTGSASDGFGGTDALRGINIVLGSRFDDTLTGSALLVVETFVGGGGNDTIQGGAIADALRGRDANWVRFDGIAAAVTVDLAATTATGQGIDRLYSINGVVGSRLADSLHGSGSGREETFEGAGGNDTIDGSAGFDWASWQGSGVAVVADLAAGSATAGASDTDTLSNIEGLRGSHFADTLLAKPGSLLQAFVGNGGNDTIDGGPSAASGARRVDYANALTGVTVQLGGAADGSATDGLPVLGGKVVTAGTPGAVIGTDTLRNITSVRGSDFADTLNGASTVDVLEGRGGNDRIDGQGNLADAASYDLSPAGVQVTLGANGADGSAQDGWGGTDTLRGIEWVLGSREFADLLVGNELGNRLQGQGGNDSLYGGAGVDFLEGGTGDDYLSGGSGADSLSGGAGSDVYVVDSTQDQVNDDALTYGPADELRTTVTWSLGIGGSTAIERLVLTGSASIFGTGNALANQITGNGGNNLLSGKAGKDTLAGGAGEDTLAGGEASDTMTGGAGPDTFEFLEAPGTNNVDRIADFFAADDRIFLDDSAFVGIGPTGALSAAAFRQGSAALDATDRIIWSPTTGELFFDPDGIGAAPQVLFCRTQGGIGFTAADFVVI